MAGSGMALETKRTLIKLINKHIHYASKMIFPDPVI